MKILISLARALPERLDPPRLRQPMEKRHGSSANESVRYKGMHIHFRPIVAMISAEKVEASGASEACSF